MVLATCDLACALCCVDLLGDWLFEFKSLYITACSGCWSIEKGKKICERSRLIMRRRLIVGGVNSPGIVSESAVCRGSFWVFRPHLKNEVEGGHSVVEGVSRIKTPSWAACKILRNKKRGSTIWSPHGKKI